MSKKIVIAGNYGAGNLGDEMILQGVLEMLKNMFEGAEITVLSANPAETENMHKVKSLYLFPAGFRSLIKSIKNGWLKATKQAVKECDLFVLGGGGLFASIKKRANIIWALQVFWARKKPLFVLGQSLEKINGLTGRIIIAKVFSKAKVIVLRDYLSKSILETMGINKTIYVLPDPAFRIENHYAKIHDSKKAVIVLRKSRKLTDKVIHEISKFTEWLKNEKGYEINFVALHNVDKDLKENTIVPKTVEDALRLFSEAKFILGVPLHSVIGAIKTRTPFIALNYAIKLDSFLRFAGLSEWGIDSKDFSLEKFKEKYLEVEKHHLKIEENLDILNKKASKELKIFEENFKRHNVF